ncbi:hypothetical protein RP20_CCG004581 [Aedes albopictus]|nr:hypothetical protein RP20_CCG004581 [Aedes albopictus]
MCLSNTPREDRLKRQPKNQTSRGRSPILYEGTRRFATPGYAHGSRPYPLASGRGTRHAALPKVLSGMLRDLRSRPSRSDHVPGHCSRKASSDHRMASSSRRSTASRHQAQRRPLRCDVKRQVR